MPLPSRADARGRLSISSASSPAACGRSSIDMDSDPDNARTVLAPPLRMKWPAADLRDSSDGASDLPKASTRYHYQQHIQHQHHQHVQQQHPPVPPVADLSRVRPSNPPREQPLVVRQYSLDTRLGSGAFGTVWKGFNLKTGEAVAIKKITSSRSTSASSAEDRDDGMRQARDEIRIMKPLQHDHILKYFDAFEQRDPYEAHDSLYIVLEYCEIGSLNKWFKQPNLVDRERLIAKYMGQVLDGLSYLHHQGVIHRDIKGDNILLVKNASVKLADFGIATAVAAVQGSDKVQGTPYWMAPEALLSKPTTKSDIWSVGCVVIELMQKGQHPWYLLSDINASYRALNGQHPSFPSDVTELGRDFLRVCFQTDQALRLDADMLRRHRWVLQSNDGQPRGFYDDLTSTSSRLTLHSDEPNDREEGWGRPSISGFDAANLFRLDHSQKRRSNAAVTCEVDAWERPSGGSTGGGTAIQGLPRNTPSVTDEDPWDEGLDISDARPLLPPQPPLTPSSLTQANQESGLDFDSCGSPQSEPDEGVDDLERRLLEDERDAEEMEAWSRARESAELRREQVIHFVEQVSQYTYLDELEDSLNRLQALFQEDARQKHTFFSAQGAFSLLELIEKQVLPLNVLRVLNVLASNDVEAQAYLCVIGAIPVIKPFTEPHCDYELRLEAGRFFTTMCLSRGQKTRFNQTDTRFAPRTILSCGGLKAIADMLAENYTDEGKELVWLGAACVRSILGLPVSIFFPPFTAGMWPLADIFCHSRQGRKSTYCNLLVRDAVLDPLSIAMQNVASDDESPQASSARQHIFETLNILSRSDTHVRVQLAQGSVPRRLLRVIESELLATEPGLLNTALQCVKNLSMTPDCAEGLRKRGNAVEILTHLLTRHLSDEDHRAADEIITTLYYLCRLSPLRQKEAQHAPLEEAAEAGAVPVLLGVANSISIRKSVVKPFAVSMLCDMAQAGNATRQKLWPKALEQYLEMVSTDYWAHQQSDISLPNGGAQAPDYHSQAQALGSICTWLQSDFARIEHVLLKPANLRRLVQYLQAALEAASMGASTDLLTPLIRLTRLAHKVAHSLMDYDDFVASVELGLQEGKPGEGQRKNDYRLNLLRLVRAIVETHPEGHLVLNRGNLFSTLCALEQSTDEGAVIVKGLATEILRTHSSELSPSPDQEMKTTAKPSGHSRQHSSADVNYGQHRRPRVISQTRTSTNPSALPQQVPPPLGLGLRRPTQVYGQANGLVERSKRTSGVRSPTLPLSPTQPSLPSPLVSPDSSISQGMSEEAVTTHKPTDRQPCSPSLIVASQSSPAVASAAAPGPNRKVLRTLPVQKQSGSSIHAHTRQSGSADWTMHRPWDEVTSFGSAITNDQASRTQPGVERPPSPSTENDDSSITRAAPRLSRRIPSKIPGFPRSKSNLPTPDSVQFQPRRANDGTPSSTRSHIPSSPSHRRPSLHNGIPTSITARRSVSSSHCPPHLATGLKADSQLARGATSASHRRPFSSSPACSEDNPKSSGPSSPTATATRPPPLATSRLFSTQISALPRMHSQASLNTSYSARPERRYTSVAARRRQADEGSGKG